MHLHDRVLMTSLGARSITARIAWGALGTLGACGALWAGYTMWRKDREQTAAVVAVAATKPLVVFTDLEPDDLMALWVLKRRNMTPAALVVGEGDVAKKVARATQYARDLGWYKTLIVPGLPSAKDTPEGDVPAIDPGPDLSAAVTTLAGIARLCSASSSDSTNAATGMPPTLLCLKPPRELVAAMAHDAGADGADGAGDALAPLKDLRLCIYGSFNLEQVGRENVVAWFNPATTPFKQVLWYENFGGMAAGTRNLNASTVPRTYLVRIDADWGVAVDPFCKKVAEFARVWDEFMLKDCEGTMRSIEAEDAHWKNNTQKAERHARNARCAEDIRRGLGRQIVAADPVLAVVMDNPDLARYGRAVLSVTLPAAGGSGYPVVQLADAAPMGTPATATAKVVKYVALPDDVVLDKLADAYHDIFGYR